MCRDKLLVVVAAASIIVGTIAVYVGNKACNRAEAYMQAALDYKDEADAYKGEADAYKARLSVAKGQLADAERRIAEARKGLTKEQRQILASNIAGRPGTLAFKNRNPLNIKHLGKQKWIGEIGRDAQGHVIFSNINYGLRAAVMTLYSYETRHGIKDLNSLIERFCGGNDDYVKFLSDNMGLKPDEKFSITKRMPELVRLMSIYESGREVKPEIIATLDILKRL